MSLMETAMAPDSLPNGLPPSPKPNGCIGTAEEIWLVQKFGGTSVGKFPLDIVNNVVRQVLSLNL